MKKINTYRHIAAKILRATNQPVTKPMLYKLSHFLNKLEKDCHTGPDVMNGHYTIDGLVNKFVEETGPEGIQAKFAKYCETH